MVARSVDGEMRGARERLVETLREKGIRDLAVLRAFEMTPRHAFVPTGLRHRAYEDAPLPIGNGQTISQPWVHARYLELLELTGKERVLEVGTGSGYQTVLLAHLVEQVFSIERIPALLQQAREAMQARRRAKRFVACSATAALGGGSTRRTTRFSSAPARRRFRSRSSTNWPRAAGCSSRSATGTSSAWCSRERKGGAIADARDRARSLRAARRARTAGAPATVA